MVRLTPLFAVLLAALVITACAPPPGGGITESEPDRPAERAEPREGFSPAVRDLVASAESASNAGKDEEAAYLIERALRIEPRNPVLWQNLAVIHYRRDDYAEAENLAQRSNALAGDDIALQRSNWALIEASRRLRGDEAGAEEAREHLRALEAR